MGSFRLGGIFAPLHAGKKCQETETQLHDHQKKDRNRRPPDSFDFRILREGANGRPSKNQGYQRSIEDVRQPAHAVMAKHGAEKELQIDCEDRKQRQS